MMRKPETGTEDKLIGQQLGDYLLKRLLATGGMARIYEAYDTRLHRPAAVKVLSLTEAGDDKTLTQRFEREARAIARLDHPHIINIFASGEEMGLRYLAMKYIEGKDLAQEIARLRRNHQKMEPARALRILHDVASALDFAHAQAIVHRDVKPSNILLDRDDRAVLTDFGLILHKATDTTSTQTHGTAFGTPRYIAPEQALASANAVSQSDTYSLAVILYEILTGEAPFSGETPMEIALGHIGDPPRPPRQINPKIPPGVQQEILKALEKDPKQRHQTAVEFVNAVKDAYRREQPEAIRGMPTVMPQPHTTIMTIPEERPATAKEAVGDGSTQRIGPDTGAALHISPPAERRRWSRLLIAIPTLLILGLLAYVALNASNSTLPSNAITLLYDEDSLIIYNGYDTPLDTFPLQFIRGVDGEGRDDYSGDRFPQNTLPSKNCYVLYLLGDARPELPEQCAPLYGFEQLGDAERLFWRSEPVDVRDFSALYTSKLLANCPSVSAGQQDSCTLRLETLTPSPPA